MAFLYLQSYSPFGRVPVSKIPKRQFHHWINKLQSAGFIKKENNHYILISNERAWALLGIRECKCKNKVRHSYRKLQEEFHSMKWSEFKRNTVDDIQAYQTDRKKVQIRRRIRLGSPKGAKQKELSLFSGLAAARMFGYKSPVTGSKYRKKWFDLVEEPLRRRRLFTSDGYPYWKFDCKRILLKDVFHEVK